MDFIIGLFIGVSLGFFWGVWRATQSFIERIMERPEEIREIMSRVEKIHQESDQEIEQAAISATTNEVRAEFHQGVCYLYDHNDQFLAQGATASDAMDAAKKRFPDMKFYYRLNDADKSSQ